MICEAVVSPCGVYRYRLTRVWDTGLPRLLWVMLNPSTADAAQDDPTIRKVTGFTRRAGYGGFDVLNLASFRATDPKALMTRAKADLPLNGPDVRTHRDAAYASCAAVVVAWGANRAVDGCPGRLFWLRSHKPVLCLGVTKDGHPRHPLYVPGEQPLTPWPAPTAPEGQGEEKL